MITKQRNFRLTDYEFDFLKDALYKKRNSIKNVEPEHKQVNMHSAEDWIKDKGLPQSNITSEVKKGYTDNEAWKEDKSMLELDRGCVYELDGFGFPDVADLYSRSYPKLWVQAYTAKNNKDWEKYNEAMMQFYEIMKGLK